MPVALSAFHWQPVRNTNRIPFIAWRSATRGRPPRPRACRRGLGRSGSTLLHNWSDTSQRSCDLLFPIDASLASPLYHCQRGFGMGSKLFTGGFLSPSCPAPSRAAAGKHGLTVFTPVHTGCGARTHSARVCASTKSVERLIGQCRFRLRLTRLLTLHGRVSGGVDGGAS